MGVSGIARRREAALAGVEAAAQRRARHSPAGFAPGSGGSGPAERALNILPESTGEGNIAAEHPQAFKGAFAAPLPFAGGKIEAARISEWMAERRPGPRDDSPHRRSAAKRASHPRQRQRAATRQPSERNPLQALPCPAATRAAPRPHRARLRLRTRSQGASGEVQPACGIEQLEALALGEGESGIAARHGRASPSKSGGEGVDPLLDALAALAAGNGNPQGGAVLERPSAPARPPMRSLKATARVCFLSLFGSRILSGLADGLAGQRENRSASRTAGAPLPLRTPSRACSLRCAPPANPHGKTAGPARLAARRPRTGRAGPPAAPLADVPGGFPKAGPGPALRRALPLERVVRRGLERRHSLVQQRPHAGAGSGQQPQRRRRLGIAACDPDHGIAKTGQTVTQRRKKRLARGTSCSPAGRGRRPRQAT